jgi:hypothetical protein
MRLLQQVWRCSDGHSHNVIQVDFEDADIKRAVWIADQKLQFVNVHSPGGVVRSPAVIRNRIISGKLADQAVKYLINSTIASRGLSLVVQEYDEVRVDGWRNPDLFDLQISSSASHRDIEVRSSFSYILQRPERIIQRLSIYGWYVSGNKPSEPPRDFYWQVFYYMRPRDISKQADWPDVPVFEDQLVAGSVRGYIIGGATKELLNDKSLAGIRRDQDRAFYQSISPICRGMDVSEILDATLTLP